MKSLREDISYKADKKNRANLSFLGICFSLFTFIIAIRSEILQDNYFVALQLTLAIPLFLSSMFARIKLGYTKRYKMWDSFGFVTFLVGYSFLISTIGILLSSGVDILLGMIFFGLNILVACIYSILEVIENKDKLKSRMLKDLFFIIMLVIFGILPSLGFLVWS